MQEPIVDRNNPATTSSFPGISLYEDAAEVSGGEESCKAFSFMDLISQSHLELKKSLEENVSGLAEDTFATFSALNEYMDQKSAQIKNCRHQSEAQVHKATVVLQEFQDNINKEFQAVQAAMAILHDH